MRQPDHASRKRPVCGERGLNYAAAIIQLTDQVPATRAGNHLANQLLRSGTSPLSNHGEAQAAESNDDFIHKFKICLKELKESKRWLRLLMKVRLAGNEATALLNETEELIRIFAASIRTAESNAKR